MQVHVRTAGTLGRHLPPGSGANQAVMQLPEASTLATLLAQLRLPPDRSVLVAVNDTLIHADAHVGHVLSDGDVVAVMPPLKGG